MNHAKPEVSVCVPTYNYARYLSTCIESVRTQTHTDWELVVSDDCSSDATHELLNKYAAADPRIKYFRNEHRLGMSPNLRRAAGLAKGRYIKMLCADDWLAPNCLESFCRLMRLHPGATLATSAEINCDENGVAIAQQFKFGEPVTIIPGEAMLDRMARGHGFGGNSSFFLRRDAYTKAGGYDGSVAYASDYDLAARLCRQGCYLHTDEALFFGRNHPASSRATDPKKLLDVIDWFRLPEKLFRPRRFMNREWRRYHQLTAQVTSRYLFTIASQYAKGNHEYAATLWSVVRQHGNLATGAALLPIHAPHRIIQHVSR